MIGETFMHLRVNLDMFSHILLSFLYFAIVTVLVINFVFIVYN